MLTWFRRRPLAIVIVAVALFFLWLAFRPELLFVNKTVNDPFPTSAATVTNSSQDRH